MNLNEAIQKHGEWKLKIRTSISRHETLDVVAISKDNCCELGKWLHGEARQTFGDLAGYKDCVTRHARFHSEAAKVAQAINARHFTEAEASLEPGSSYMEASSAVGAAIMHLKREAKL